LRQERRNIGVVGINAIAKGPFRVAAVSSPASSVNAPSTGHPGASALACRTQKREKERPNLSLFALVKQEQRQKNEEKK